MSDQKIKTSAAKAPLNMVPLKAITGASRVFGYGAKKYAAGNYYTASDDDVVNRYVGGVMRHLGACQRPDGIYSLDSITRLDDESGLPELDHAICGLIMLRSILAKRGALPEDPGVGNDPLPAAVASKVPTVDLRSKLEQAKEMRTVGSFKAECSVPNCACKTGKAPYSTPLRCCCAYPMITGGRCVKCMGVP